MKKKSVDRKAVQRTIMDGRASGKTDQEIYYELSQEGYDKKAIALLVTGTVTAENKAKYKTYNNLLLALIGLTIILKVLMVFASSNGEVSLLLVFIAPLINVLFFIGIAQYNAPVYRICGALTIVSLFVSGANEALRLLETADGSPNVMDIFVGLVLSALIVGFCFYLDRKLFPNFRPSKLKKDGNGEYIL
jgi:hypothetical protein